MSDLSSYYARVRELLTSRGGVKTATEGTSEATSRECWETPTKLGGKLLLSFYPFGGGRTIFQCFDAKAGRAIVQKHGFKANGVMYNGVLFSPFSYKANFQASKDSDLQKWENFILEVTEKLKAQSAA